MGYPQNKGPNFRLDTPQNMAAAAAANANQARQIDAFERDQPTAHVIRVPHANRYIFISNEIQVLIEMNKFLDALSRAKRHSDVHALSQPTFPVPSDRHPFAASSRSKFLITPFFARFDVTDSQSSMMSLSQREQCERSWAVYKLPRALCLDCSSGNTHLRQKREIHPKRGRGSVRRLT
jgi:hypothetical protein